MEKLEGFKKNSNQKLETITEDQRDVLPSKEFEKTESIFTHWVDQNYIQDGKSTINALYQQKKMILLEKVQRKTNIKSTEPESHKINNTNTNVTREKGSTATNANIINIQKHNDLLRQDSKNSKSDNNSQ